jgi:clan AA aspartic protease
VITGVINSDYEAVVALLVLGTGALQQQVATVVDTGFNGHLTLPPTVIASLQLQWLGRDPAELADGSMQLFDVYRGTVLWNGQPRAIDIDEADSQPLLGMRMLQAA